MEMNNSGEKFLQLLKGLETGLIIFIDDDFIFMDTALEEIVCDLLLLKSESFSILLGKFNERDYSELVLQIKEFRDIFETLPLLEEHIPLFTDLKMIIRYLELYDNLNNTDNKILADKLINSIDQILKTKRETHELFLRFGVGLGSVNSYSDMMDLTKSINYRVYNKKPSLDCILEDINESLAPNQFCLCIVDRVLKEEDGVHFLKNELIPNTENKNIISIIYTSQPQNTTPQTLVDYYVIEVDKSDKEIISKLTSAVSLCTFVEIFSRLNFIHKNSIDEAFQVALSRKDNMIYLASMANEEGITPYEAISNWFKLATQYQLESAFTKENTIFQYHNLVGLTKFLSGEFLESELFLEEGNWESLQGLNSFEIFDYTINYQHQPPTPGDVYRMSDGTFRILVGQDCDFMVRGTQVVRKAKSVDLLNAEFIATQIYDKYQKKSKSLELNYFFKDSSLDNNNYGILKIDYEKISTSDFIILDLCSLNSDGQSKLETGIELDEKIKALLPMPWSKYFTKMQGVLNQYKSYRELCETNGLELELLQSNDLSAVNYEFENDVFSYPIKRVARIKREFREIVLNSYWEYKKRVGINTINYLDKEKINYLDLKIGLPGLEFEKIKDMNVDVYIRKGTDRKRNIDPKKMSYFINIESLKEEYPLLSNIQENIIELEKVVYEHKSSKIIFKKIILGNRVDSIQIILPYQVGKHKVLLQQDKFLVTDLLNSEQKRIAKEKALTLYYIFKEDERQKNYLFNVNKDKFNQLDVPTLKRGILIPELNIRINLMDGIIEVESIEEMHTLPMGS
ncbi:hypothetical protein [Paenibacillus sp. FSL R10-2734]|uniref:hypothetical protein n=1 Tax=Paenibacillus sp. FSL R10-2734 TaxID=2954691 RepID=UPI0030DCFD74